MRGGYRRRRCYLGGYVAIMTMFRCLLILIRAVFFGKMYLRELVVCVFVGIHEHAEVSSTMGEVMQRQGKDSVLNAFLLNQHQAPTASISPHLNATRRNSVLPSRVV